MSSLSKVQQQVLSAAGSLDSAHGAQELPSFRTFDSLMKSSVLLRTRSLAFLGREGVETKEDTSVQLVRTGKSSLYNTPV